MNRLEPQNLRKRHPKDVTDIKQYLHLKFGTSDYLQDDAGDAA